VPELGTVVTRTPRAIRSAVVTVALGLCIGLVGVDIAAAQTCDTVAAALVGGTCTPSTGWIVFAQVVECSTPSSVNAEVYDSGMNLIETIPLARQAGGAWNGLGACYNPNAAYQVRFVATGGTIDYTTGQAFGVQCGNC
jgi:hypothetical protein